MREFAQLSMDYNNLMIKKYIKRVLFMRKFALVISILALSLAAPTSRVFAQGVPTQPVNVGESDMVQQFEPVQVIAPIKDEDSGQVHNDPLNAAINRAAGALQLKWPTEAISFDQLQSVINQFPGLKEVQLQFPNNTQVSLSPASLLSMHSNYVAKAGSLGFGVGASSLPQMVFSSLAQQVSGSGNTTLLPVSQLKEGMGEALEPVLREMRYQQLALASYLPDWLKDFLLAMYNFIMPYFDALMSWIGSFF